ncbi:MAG: hypothetical protein K6A44_05230 [bacterium]|nr:hypothetical protein [bacterium]
MCIKIVREAQAMVIERLGKFKKVLPSGLHFIVPFMDTPRKIIWRQSIYTPDGGIQSRTIETDRIDLREQVHLISEKIFAAKDGKKFDITSLIYFQVIDVEKAVYEIIDVFSALENLTEASIRNIMKETDADNVSMADLSSQIKIILSETAQRWGLKINEFKIKEINRNVG